MPSFFTKESARFYSFPYGKGNIYAHFFSSSSSAMTWDRYLASPRHAAISNRLWGNPAEIEADCKALSPPAKSKTAAAAPSDTPQNIRFATGGFGLPPEVTMSSTNDPESDEVIKKMTISNSPIHCMTSGQGSRSNNTLSDMAGF